MPNVLTNVLQLFTGEPVLQQSPSRSQPTPKQLYKERDLLRMESAIGRELFGPVPRGHQREFFCLDERTWIWYEHWTDTQTGAPQEQTTRYEVHSNGVIKIQEGQPYKILEGAELKNLERAVRIYHQRVMLEVYGREAIPDHTLSQTAA